MFGPRDQYFGDFIKDSDLELSVTEATYISPAGNEISTLDYFVVDKRPSKETYTVTRLDDIVTHKLNFKLLKSEQKETNKLHNKNKPVKAPQLFITDRSKVGLLWFTFICYCHIELYVV